MTRQYTRWTEERVSKLRAIARTGASRADAAERMGVSGHSLEKAAKRYRIMFGGYPRWTESDDATLRRMAAVNATSGEIGKIIGKTASAIYSYAKDHGIPLRRGRRPSAEKYEDVGTGPIGYKRRRCLCGGEMFDARVNADGRFLEYSCAQHRNQANRDDTGAGA